MPYPVSDDDVYDSFGCFSLGCIVLAAILMLAVAYFGLVAFAQGVS